MQTSRVEAFSDGVFAIAITLLILSVGIDRAPHGDLGTYLVDLWPAYLAYAVSFLTIGIMWVNHHLLFDNFARVDRPMLLLNILLLMLIAFVPFPTHVLAAHRSWGIEWPPHLRAALAEESWLVPIYRDEEFTLYAVGGPDGTTGSGPAR